ncbi:hypothetical protein KVR01_012889 [Diaporthe batatas]|uniref:uncharacterized protein n=1 Tax=Diaporthe batatas TaxID=748121 RepID=UPI001D03AAD4|nr:uncharacterized protein KVR01_012889 [Diaporthe batatas]KAG8157181.1 hypothetical protein KVR01_012889 [Diaporthe batatas]
MQSAAMETTLPELIFENVEDGEVIYQRCLIIKARFSPPADAPSMVTVEQSSEPFDALFPPQTWPVEDGNTKMIVMLSVGVNHLSIHPNSDATQTHNLRLTYSPDTRLPPLHLASNIPHFGNPGSLGSVLGRFRMAAYMWQAMIAEDMRKKGLGRRSFRLDESWDPDTTSVKFKHAARDEEATEMGVFRNTAKIHLVKSEHTTEEIRDARIAQDNPLGVTNAIIYHWFLAALQHSRVPILNWPANPIVAGLIIDATWSEDDFFTVGHAAVGGHESLDVSLCTFGSHLMWSWPEHLEDIQRCLTDVTRPEEGVVDTGKDRAGTKWEVCAIGQTQFLHQLAHAFGAGHSTGITNGDGASHWPRHFVARTSPSTLTGEVGIVVDQGTANDAVFDLKDLLTFKHLPHFWMEGDEKVPGDPLVTRTAIPTISYEFSASEDLTVTMNKVMVASPAKIVRVLWNGEPGIGGPTLANPIAGVSISTSDIDAEYSRAEPLRVAFLAGNGKERVIPNLWDLLDPANLHVPGSEVVLHRRSVKCGDLENGRDDLNYLAFWSWATLLTKPMAHGTIARANEINSCVKESLLGLYVRFQDGARVNCGPRREVMEDGKHEKHFGGDREDCMIPPNHDIVRVEVSRDSLTIVGIRFHLSNGDAKGSLTRGLVDYEPSHVLEPPSGERIIGFFGRNYFLEDLDSVAEFGIITAPIDFKLPPQVYDMPQLQNTDGGMTKADYKRDDDPRHIMTDWSELDSEEPEDPDSPQPPQAPFEVDDSDEELMAGVGGMNLNGPDVDE